MHAAGHNAANLLHKISTIWISELASLLKLRRSDFIRILLVQCGVDCSVTLAVSSRVQDVATLRRIGVLKIGVVMEVYLSHWSALRCWRLLRRMGSLSSSYIELGACAPHGRPSLRATRAELQRVRDAYGLGDNLHVLVAGMNRRHRREGTTVHGWAGGVKAPCFLELEPGLHLSSPALCFLQLSSELDQLGLIKLGYELCSTYALAESGAIVDSPPLSSLKAISDLAAEWPLNGVKKARRALEYVREGSHSPKETELAMKLGLPSRLGGFGLSGFKMNSSVELGAFGQEVTGTSCCIPDLLWAEHKLDVEYNGREWHSFPEQRERDLRRRQALVNEGYTVLTVEQRIIESPRELRRLADEVSLLTAGRRLRLRSKCYEAKSRELFSSFAAEGSHVKEGRAKAQRGTAAEGCDR